MPAMDAALLRTRAEIFHELHAGPELLVLANAWDVASARLVEAAGFPAVATSSAGAAWSLGYPDGERIPRAEMLALVGRVTGAVEVPVTADLEAGYGASPEAVAETVRQAIAAGAVGMNLEDSSAEAGHRLLDHDLAVARVRAARGAADELGLPFVINARTDAFFPTAMAGEDRFAEAVRRARAYRDAGARSVFVPFVEEGETIGRLAAAIDAPLNVLAGPRSPPLGRLRALGVARVSLGGSLARAAYGALRRALGEIRAAGTYTFNEGAASFDEMNQLLAGR